MLGLSKKGQSPPPHHPLLTSSSCLFFSVLFIMLSSSLLSISFFVIVIQLHYISLSSMVPNNMALHFCTLLLSSPFIEYPFCAMQHSTWVRWRKTRVNDNNSPLAAWLSSVYPWGSHLTPICCIGISLWAVVENCGVYGLLQDARAGSALQQKNYVCTI